MCLMQRTKSRVIAKPLEGWAMRLEPVMSVCIVMGTGLRIEMAFMSLKPVFYRDTD